MATLLEYLTELSTNAASIEEFRRDPKASIERAGLSREEREALLSGDSSQVWRLMPTEMVEGRFPPPNVTITVTLVVIKFGGPSDE